jgi:hypothetical protein
LYRLGERDHAGLPLDGAVDGHGVRMREGRCPAGPFRSDRQKWCQRDRSVALTPFPAITS